MKEYIFYDLENQHLTTLVGNEFRLEREEGFFYIGLKSNDANGGIISELVGLVNENIVGRVIAEGVK